jgi:hypothetical protein
MEKIDIINKNYELIKSLLAFQSELSLIISDNIDKNIELTNTLMDLQNKILKSLRELIDVKNINI